MDSILKSFRHSRLAIGASLGCAIGVDFLKVHPTLPTNPFQQTQECSKRCVNAFFPEHPSIESNSVQIFCKNSLRLVAKLVGIFQMKVFATDGDMVMKFGYLNLCFFPVFRTSLFPCGSALQHFQPTLHSLKELRTFDITAIRRGDKPLQSQINTNSTTMNRYVRNADIRLDGCDDIPLSSSASRRYSDLLNSKPIRDRSMQGYRNKTNFGQFNLVPNDGTLFKLRKQKRLELSVLLKSRKPKVSLAEVLPSVMQAFNYVLQYLRMNILESCPCFLEYRQLTLLLHVSRKRDICTDDVFLFQRTPVNHALATIHPVFEFSQGIVIKPATTF